MFTKLTDTNKAAIFTVLVLLMAAAVALYVSRGLGIASEFTAARDRRRPRYLPCLRGFQPSDRPPPRRHRLDPESPAGSLAADGLGI